MGAGESKFCQACEKEFKSRSAAHSCHFCTKIVCTGCSTKEAPGGGKGSSKVRMCLVCKLNRLNRETGDDGSEAIVSKPTDFKKVINVSHDNKTGTYSGLPQLWRELLDMPLSHSKNEIDTSQMDATIAPVSTKRQ
jgi:FYVE zinc finger/P21-Rho-binding domain